MTKNESYLTAVEAARMLGISLPTLYSYVSRGLIRSESADRRKRTRRYLTEDVTRLKERQELRRDPSRAPATALHWGVPILESALTLIADGRLYYRGRDALELARMATVEQTAALLWTGSIDTADSLFAAGPTPLSERCEAVRRSLANVSPLERMQTLVPLAAADDLASYDMSPASVARTGVRLLNLMAGLVPKPSEGTNPREAVSASSPSSIAAALQRALRPDDPAAIRAIEMILILCADHELNVSSFSARCVASAGSPPYAVVSAGLAALQGVRHGGNCTRVEAFLRDTARPENARATLTDRIKRGDGAPGFGHRLYPQGDPRGRMLLEQAVTLRPEAPVVLLAAALAWEAEQALGEFPNLDFGLVTLCAALDLPSGTALALFALGRTIGWIGHASEEYTSGRLIRPRAHYIGEPAPPIAISGNS